MDILIVGNGFDLSHFLPTKYDHFMEAMISIDNFQSSTEMKFDDIYKNLIEKENYFFSKTKELYRCDLIKLDEDQVKIFKEKLQSNIWYKYFLEHVNDIKTWIDFEQKIDEALIYATKAIKNIEEKHLNSSSFNNPIYTTPSSNQVNYFFTEFQFNILTCLNFINEQPRAPNSRYRSGLLNKVYFKSETTEFYGFDSHKFLYFLQSELEKFIDIFNLYLLYIIDKFIPISNFEVKELKNIKKIFSFNYTNSFEKFYDSNIPINYLHGKFGLDHNLVLGISDLKDDSLKDLKAYGFTKYHQKIFKDTHYNFLSEEITKIKYYTKKIEEITLDYRSGIRPVTNVKSYTSEIQTYKNIINGADLNIFIWGHSLDISDEVYINEIFSFNEPSDNNVRVTIFHFNKSAKFDLLTNLFHILGKEKVEKWMKKGWLTFKENPEITQID
ncbi:AbiH family protein [Acinetobacter baumannii]|uniref:AbiH family protein n=2 Tax=Acinetobacter baumannii TaxID=470 RepID=UPI0007F87D27|nr:AbiH family protein [Acinetobacter baumannii]EHU2111150.1 hypothetical protein [Acinetobacter baumannii]ELA7053610.1 hypothetical protein [Acinetobacter baumannii]OBM18412.1 hypothetical protein A9933_03750 [Acinetobacter baumannii]